jgi:3-hydroxymyristoyl/3-hydroxydecanoyl-(acyl carrier protein) dehydratase
MNKIKSLPDVSELRQKPPFLFVERVESIDLKRGYIVALMSKGDGQKFKSLDCLPTYMLLEALAQAGGILSKSVIGASRRGYVSSFESVMFEKPSSLSSTVVHLRVQLAELIPPFYGLNFSATCEDMMLVEGKMRVYVEY